MTCNTKRVGSVVVELFSPSFLQFWSATSYKDLQAQCIGHVSRIVNEAIKNPIMRVFIKGRMEVKKRKSIHSDIALSVDESSVAGLTDDIL